MFRPSFEIFRENIAQIYLHKRHIKIPYNTHNA